MRRITDHQKPARPIRVLQFGTGGFLRGFADWMLQKVNDTSDFNGSVVVAQSTATGIADTLNNQNGLYTHIIQDSDETSKQIIDVIDHCINLNDRFEDYLDLARIPTLRFVISNTTEAGIVFDPNDEKPDRLPKTFPGKLTLLMKRRFDLGLPGFIFLPCELIDRNGEALQDCILKYANLWNYSNDFIQWVTTENTFCCTLVDRINTGYPAGYQLDYQDVLANASEKYHLWVIETDINLESELPLQKAGLNVIITTSELHQYHTRKVRILNGAHASIVCHGLLKGLETVQDCVEDLETANYLHRCIFDEIIPTLDLPQKELEQYARDVLRRFENPYVHHKLSAISLNSISKFKVRILPTILGYKQKFGTYPPNLCYAFSQLLTFYQTDLPNDAPEVTTYLKTHTKQEILSNYELWGANLSDLIEVIDYADPPK